MIGMSVAGLHRPKVGRQTGKIPKRFLFPKNCPRKIVKLARVPMKNTF